MGIAALLLAVSAATGRRRPESGPEPESMCIYCRHEWHMPGQCEGDLEFESGRLVDECECQSTFNPIDS